MTAILLLAAGASRRMGGRDKLVEPIDGQPLLRRSALAALGTGAPVICTLPPDRPLRRAALTGLDLTLVEVPDAATGMAASLRAGLRAVPDRASGVMVLSADMPGFTTAALSGLIAAQKADPQALIRGGDEDGTPGHPVLFPRDLWAALAQITGDEGGRSVIRAHQDRVRVIPLPGRMALLDLDTPEDWAAFRAAQP
jgi:CTP:molybdopterin cytidylyltransferase MocA